MTTMTTEHKQSIAAIKEVLSALSTANVLQHAAIQREKMEFHAEMHRIYAEEADRRRRMNSDKVTG